MLALPAWIEEGDGTIVRGVAETVTVGGARVRLPVQAGLRQGEGVALRLSIDPERPTLAATARVSRLQSESGEVECDLEWTEKPASLDEWLASRG